MKSEHLTKGKRICGEIQQLADLAQVFKDRRFGNVFLSPRIMNLLGKKFEAAVLQAIGELEKELKELS